MAKLNIGITGNNSNIKKVIQETDALLKQLQTTANNIKFNIGGQNAASNAKAVANAIREQRLETEKARTSTQENRSEQARLSAELAKTRLALSQLTLAKRQNQSATTAASGSYREAQQRLTALGNAIRTAQGGFNGTNPAIRAQVEEYRKLNAQLKAFDAQMGNHQRNVGNYRSVLGGLGENIKTLIAGDLSFQAVIQGVGAAFQSSLRSDALQTSLGFILNNGQDAANRLDRVRVTADRLGLSYLDLGESYRSFIGAANASNFNLLQAEKIFNAVSNASGKLKLSSDQTRGALLALQQMISKGNVQAEELRGQLGERLPGAFAIAARAMGVTEQQLNKMLQQGEVLAADLLPKLADELNKTFGNDQTERIESLQASVNRLSNVFDEAVQDGRISKFFQAIVDGVAIALNNINKLVNSDSWQELFLRATTLINPATKPFIDPELNRQDITRGGQSGFINSRVEELTNST